MGHQDAKRSDKRCQIDGPAVYVGADTGLPVDLIQILSICAHHTVLIVILIETDINDVAADTVDFNEFSKPADKSRITLLSKL